MADLVARHLPLVRTIARRYRRSGEPLDDLHQVASVGLVAAARRFDPARGVPFAAYAVPTIEGELRRHMRDRVSTVRVPRREQELAIVLRRAASAVAQRLGHEASIDEAAAAAGVSTEDARAALRASVAPMPLTALDRHACPSAQDEIDACERRALVGGLLAALTPQERELLRLRFDEDLSQTEIARRVHISQSQASRLLAGALEKLRRAA